jgi:hypothetical protein
MGLAKVVEHFTSFCQKQMQTIFKTGRHHAQHRGKINGGGDSQQETESQQKSSSLMISAKFKVLLQLRSCLDSETSFTLLNFVLSSMSWHFFCCCLPICQLKQAF